MFRTAEDLQKQLKKVEEIQVGNYLVTIQGRLAEGGFGFIDLVTDNASKELYVLKRCSVNHEAAYTTVQKEIRLLQYLKSPYIVKLLDTIMLQSKAGPQALILLEYCPGGNLFERLTKRQGKYIQEHMLFKFFFQLLQPIAEMHQQSPYIVHRDLKLENILLSSNGDFRLCDFGSAIFGPVSIRTPAERSEAESVINKETTPIYRAPEMVDLYMREELTEKTDIWALGCIFYAMCYLKLPFAEGATLAILNDKIHYPPIHKVSDTCVTILKRMLDFDPEARPDVHYLLAATQCVLNGQPLPPYEISALARERKAAREAAKKKTNAPKQVAKASGPVIPARSSAPSGTSSAAERRLAAMKGGQVSTSSNALDPHAFDFKAPFDDGLGSFGVSQSATITPPANKTDPFDGFGSASHSLNSSASFSSGFPDLGSTLNSETGDFTGFFDDGFVTSPKGVSDRPQTGQPTSTRSSFGAMDTPFDAMDGTSGTDGGVKLGSSTISVSSRGTSKQSSVATTPASSRPTSIRNPHTAPVDFMNTESKLQNLSLLDTPNVSNKTAEVLSLFETKSDDPFRNPTAPPPKPPRPSTQPTMRVPSARSMNISGDMSTEQRPDPLESLKMI